MHLSALVNKRKAPNTTIEPGVDEGDHGKAREAVINEAKPIVSPLSAMKEALR